MAIAHETFRYILFPFYMKYINTVILNCHFVIGSRAISRMNA